ncbi:MAG: hypothetical protein JXR73_10710 [Candidatus Omnitrophica bacterium]|nr:hypothetical protein [Candidatus Omnitrophota bacterium]
MSNLSCSRIRSVDIVQLHDDLDPGAVEELARTISSLRRRGGRRILLLGGRLRRISSDCLERLSLPIRVFCRAGGRIALAEFSPYNLKKLQSTSWRRLLNTFHTQNEALHFLSPSAPE